MNNRCPYCNKTLDKIPKRKSQCPHCNKFFVIRSGQIVTESQGILIDSKKRLEYINLAGVSQAKSLDELWGILNKAVLDYSVKGKFDKVATIYLNMGVITEAEGHYKECIQNYLLCSHFSAYNTVKDYKKLKMSLTFDDLLASENYMNTSPIANSVKQLGLDQTIIDDLGVLSVSPSITIQEKLKILTEVFNGNYTNLKNIPKEQKISISVRRAKNNWENEPVIKKKKSGCFGCLGVFIGFLLIINVWLVFIR